MKKFLIVEARSIGPVVYHRDTLEQITGLLMDFFRSGCSCKTATLWKRSRNQWVPAFPWQHAEGW